MSDFATKPSRRQRIATIEFQRPIQETGTREREYYRGTVSGMAGGIVRPSTWLAGREACSSAHRFARERAALGPAARIVAPEAVRPFRVPGQNDANDAVTIGAAVRRPQLRFVAGQRSSCGDLGGKPNRVR
jgi:hypothetical protein